jgi:hypothetical protein
MSLGDDHSEVYAASRDSTDAASASASVRLQAKQLRRTPLYSRGLIIALLFILPAVCGAIIYAITFHEEQAIYEQEVGLNYF